MNHTEQISALDNALEQCQAKIDKILKQKDDLLKHKLAIKIMQKMNVSSFSFEQIKWVNDVAYSYHNNGVELMYSYPGEKAYEEQFMMLGYQFEAKLVRRPAGYERSFFWIRKYPIETAGSSPDKKKVLEFLQTLEPFAKGIELLGEDNVWCVLPPSWNKGLKEAF